MKTTKFLFSVTLILLAAVGVFAAGPIAIAFFPALASFKPSDLERYANNKLSSFDGFEGSTNYTGYGDDMLDFGGNFSFASVTDAQRTYVMTLVNAHTAALKTYLLPGISYYSGHSIDGVAKDGTYYDTAHTGTHFTGSGSPSTIAEFYSFLMNNPIQLLGMRIEGSLTAQVQQQIEVTEFSPFRQLGSRVWNLNTNQTENTYRDKIVTFATAGIVMGGQTQMKLTVPAACTTTVTFYCGAILNPHAALANKTTRARNTFTAVGGAEVVRQNEALDPTKRSAAPAVLPAPGTVRSV